MITLRILHHGNCFDGLISAAIFRRFYLQRIDGNAQIRCTGMVHSRTNPFANADELFTGVDNAVVDFRYSPHERLTWWCDHHATAFLSEEDRHHFEKDGSGQKHFDPSAPSCAGLLARWLETSHGFDATPFHDHIFWAERIDSAAFESPEEAVELNKPAMQLMSLMESGLSETLSERLVSQLSTFSISDVRELPDIDRAVRPVLDQHRKMVDVFRQHLQKRGRVAFFDLSTYQISGFNKFIPYYLLDQPSYTVGLTVDAQRTKISVGSNPWCRPDPLVNLAELCAQYGGGGHAVVAAVSLPPDDVELGKTIARQIVETLAESS